MQENRRGALLMMAAMACFTLNDVFLKSLAGDVPLFQAVFLRGLGTIVLLTLLARGAGRLDFRMSGRDWLMVILRTTGEVGAAYFFLTALFHMPIANATAILQTLPLAVTLAGAVFLREPVGWRRLSAILVGFIGVLVIIRPGPDGFDLYAIYALVAVAFITLRDLAARGLSANVPSLTVALCGAIGVTLFAGLGMATEDWVPVSGRSVLILSGSTLFIVGGYVFSVMVMRVGDIGFIAPFRYTGLLWALLLGSMVFGEWPDSTTIAGAVIVVVTGVWLLYRENRLATLTELMSLGNRE